MSTSTLGILDTYLPGTTKYTGPQIERVHASLDTLVGFLGVPFGAGLLRQPDASSFQVSAGADLFVSIAPGAAILPVGASGFCPVRLPAAGSLGPLPASRDNSNPIYLHIVFDGGSIVTDSAGVAVTRGDSYEDGLPDFKVSSSDTEANAILLAKITTSSIAILTVTDMRAGSFVEFVSPATTSALGTLKLSTAPVNPASPVAVGDNDPRLSQTSQQLQIQSFGFVGVSALLRVGSRTDNFAPGDSTASIKTKLSGLYTDYGALSSDFGISGTNTAPVVPPPTSFTASGSGSHPGNYVQHGTANGVTGYWTGSNSNVIYWDGTHWVSGHLGVGGGADETGGTDITNPTVGWGGTYTFSSIVTPGSSGTFALLITTQGALAGQSLPFLESDTAGVTLAVTQAANIAGPPASIASLQEERQARALKTDKTTAILAWAYGQSYRLVSGTRNSNGALTAGTVIWPDGATGTFTADTLSTAFPGAVDAYHVTHVLNAITTTYTQPAVTRDATTGAVTAQPAIIVS